MRSIAEGALLVLMTFVSVGCARSAAPDRGLHVDERRLRNLQQLASRDMECPSPALRITQLEGAVWQAVGCQQAREYVLMGRGSGRYRGARWVPVAPLHERASAEMSCPPSSLAVAAQTPLERRVEGCERQASYALVCDAVQCGWMITGYDGAWQTATASQ